MLFILQWHWISVSRLSAKGTNLTNLQYSISSVEPLWGTKALEIMTSILVTMFLCTRYVCVIREHVKRLKRSVCRCELLIGKLLVSLYENHPFLRHLQYPHIGGFVGGTQRCMPHSAKYSSFSCICPDMAKWQVGTPLICLTPYLWEILDPQLQEADKNHNQIIKTIVRSLAIALDRTFVVNCYLPWVVGP